jgi:outer membrane protein assembly factor BamA
MPRFPLLLLLAAACTAHRSGEVVRKVRFAVSDRPTLRAPWAPTSNRSLRATMVQQDSSWLSLVAPGAVEPEYLERSGLPKDEQRLEVWLAEHGYFDARFERWEVERHGGGRREIRPVTVRGTLGAGPRSLLREVTIEGIDALGPRLRRGLRTTTALLPGRPFDLDATELGITAVRARLAEVGYAFATVTGEVHAWPEESAVDVVGNLELCKVVGWDVSVVGFTDAGRVWDTPADARLDGLQWTVGGGLRYATAIGPIRADLGVRLGDEFPDQPRWALHFGLSEAF